MTALYEIIMQKLGRAGITCGYNQGGIIIRGYGDYHFTGAGVNRVRVHSGLDSGMPENARAVEIRGGLDDIANIFIEHILNVEA